MWFWRRCWGQIGLPGGGFGFGWHYNGAGTPGRKGVILSGFSGSTSIPPVHDNSDYKGYSSTIPIARFIDAILEPGKVINWNGKSVKTAAAENVYFCRN
ncbi:hypothetical protein KZ773_21440 [Escherichia coli]|nr:hypothetical protein [Escherichia coli]MBW6100483.1 hypothetical protein [Escherichia coli]